MKTKQVKDSLERLGYTVNVINTRHSEWQRCFFEKDGITYGKVSLRRGEMYTMKWYGLGRFNQSPRLCENEKGPVRWRWLVETGTVLSDEDLKLFEDEALRRSKLKHKLLQEKRRQADVGLGEPKRRKPLAPPTSRRKLGEVMGEAMSLLEVFQTREAGRRK